MPTATPQSGAGPRDDRPAIAIVSNSHTPYRLHLHQRIAREIPRIKLWSLYTHELSNAPWSFAASDEIGPVMFGKGESGEKQDDPRQALREWKRGRRIIQWLEENNVRFVLMMGYNDPGRMRIIRWCHSHQVPCWLFGDSNILGDRTRGLKGVIKRNVVSRIVRWCDGVFSCGTLGKEYFVKYGADPARCFYFPYEPDYGLIRNLSPRFLEETRQKYSLAAERRRIVFSGRLTTVKRPDLLLDAFIAIADQRAEWDLLMIGNGPERQKLQSRMNGALPGRVFWTGFLDDQATVSALYRLSDVLVLPSDYEPWALVINEAAAAGLAIVSSNVVGASAELVRDGVNGRLFPPGDLASLTECLFDVTDAEKLDQRKTASATILADWQQRGDPVNGLRQALAVHGLVPP